jgi:hypothetical protein
MLLSPVGLSLPAEDNQATSVSHNILKIVVPKAISAARWRLIGLERNKAYIAKLTAHNTASMQSMANENGISNIFRMSI